MAKLFIEKLLRQRKTVQPRALSAWLGVALLRWLFAERIIRSQYLIERASCFGLHGVCNRVCEQAHSQTEIPAMLTSSVR